MLKTLCKIMDFAILTFGSVAIFLEALIGFPSLVFISGVLMYVGIAIGNVKEGKVNRR